MSRAYRIRVRESLRTVIRAEDEIRSRLELLQILPAETMATLLGEQLQAEGYRLSDDGRSAELEIQDELRIRVDVTTGEVIVTALREQSIALEDEQAERVTEPVARDQAEEALRQRILESLQDQARQQQQQLQSELTDRLEAELGDVFVQLDRVVNRTVAEALKRKAAQLGRIKEMSEDPERGSLTIVLDI